MVNPPGSLAPSKGWETDPYRRRLPGQMLFPGGVCRLSSVAGLFVLLLGFFGAWFGPLLGQTLRLKREIPGEEPFTCPSLGELPEPTAEERTEAGRLGSNADQALILGDLERARDLLARAQEVDPSSVELTYRYARVLEDLGSVEEAIQQYCRALALPSPTEGVEDARDRLQALLDREGDVIPPEAVAAFREGVREADSGNQGSARDAFTRAWLAAPSWPDPLYNRGVIRARLGRVEAAARDLERYLELAPGTEDALLVSQRVGQLRNLASLPRPSGALTLGLLLPGAGQFYSGRAWQGVGVLSLAAGVAAAGFLIEEVSVECVGGASGGECPPNRIVGETTSRPYLVHGLATAGAVAFLGAVEAFFSARGRRSEEIGALVAMKGGTVRLGLPRVAANGTRLRLNLMQISH